MYENGYLEQIQFIEKERLKTPITFFDERNLQDALSVLRRACGEDTSIFYALKSCYNKKILDFLARSGVGAEVLSEFEYDLALRANFKPIILNGMGRSKELLLKAAKNNDIIIVHTMNDLAVLSRLAEQNDIRLRLGFRMRLDLAEFAPGNAYVSENSSLGNRPSSQLFEEMVNLCRDRENVTWDMLHLHLTINQTSPAIYIEAISQTAALLHTVVRSAATEPRIINIGGGYEVFDPKNKQQFVYLFEEIKKAFDSSLHEYKLGMEPGRYLSSYAGYTIGKVLDLKKMNGKYWVITDIGTNTLIPIPNARYKLATTDVGVHSNMFTVGITDGMTSPSNNIIFEVQVSQLPEIGSYICIENTGAYTDVYSTFWTYLPHVVCGVDASGNIDILRSSEDIENIRRIYFK